MSLAHRTHSAFPSTIRARGQTYFQRDDVELTDGSDTHVDAVVQGTSAYDVTVRLLKSRVRVSCTCPYFFDHDTCKHIWATIVAADRSPHLAAAKDGAGPLRVTAIDEGDDVGHEATVTTGPRAAQNPGAQPTSAPKGTAPTPRPAALASGQPPDAPRGLAGSAWRRLVDAARASDAPPPAYSGTENIGYLLSLDRDRRGLVVDVVQRKAPSKKQPGEKLVPFGFTRSSIDRMRREEDRTILGALAGAQDDAQQRRVYGIYYGEIQLEPQFHLSPGLRRLLLPLIVGTGRCYLKRAAGEAPLLLRWDDGSPWQLEVRVTDSPSARGSQDVGFRLEGRLVRGEESIPVEQVALLLEDGTAVVGDTVARIEGAGVGAWVKGLREGVAVAAADRQALFTELYALPSAPRLSLPDGWNIPDVTVTPSPRLLLLAPDRYAPHGAPIYACLSFDYDRFEVPARHAGRVAFDAARWRLLQRDLAVELGARERLRALSFEALEYHRRPLPPERADLQIAPRLVPAAARALAAEGFRVEASGKLYRAPGEFDLVISSGIDWFELSAKVDFDGISADLLAVLAALRRGEQTMILDDGSVGVLPEEWLSRYALFVDVGSVAGGKIRYRKSQLGLLDALLATQPAVKVDAVFERAREELARASSITPRSPPKSFQGMLRPYQREGLGWLHFLDAFGLGGCLADDMGLGKTVQVLALLAERKPRAKGPALVVVPRSLVFNWKSEAARFTPDLRVLDHTGSDRSPPGEVFQGYDLVITTYGTLRRDAGELARFPFDYVILDEAQAIKNDTSDTAKAARALQANHRLALSGTPIENHLGELWSLFEFLNPGILGRASIFKGVTGKRSEIPEETLTLLAKALRPFILRRTKAAVAKDLPEKLEETWMCELEGRQRSMYDELRNHYRASLRDRLAKSGMAKSKIHILEALLRLRQAACHSGLVDPRRAGEPSAKLETLFAELPALQQSGQKALVFSQFTSLLAIVKKRLDREGIVYEYLDGQTTDRQERVERFQTDPACGLFLVSLKAGGLGLNLTAAEYVFLLDPWWNPAAEAQAIDRAHRIGQTKPVFAYRLIAKDTIEERIAALQRTKRHLAESVIEADGSLMREMTAEDLDLLLS